MPVKTLLDAGFELPSTAIKPLANIATHTAEVVNQQDQRFTVVQKFDMLAQVTEIVIRGSSHRAELIVGCGGTGKSYTVLETLAANGLKPHEFLVKDPAEEDEEEEVDANVLDASTYLKITGGMSAIGLYRLLYNNQEKTILFDDADSVFQSTQAVDILKGVLDTTGDGTVTWDSQAVRKAKLPTSFTFSGKIFFISNRKLSQLPQPLLSRALILDMDLNAAEIVERARHLGPKLTPRLSATQREELFDFVAANVASFRDVSLRMFVLASPFIEQELPNWRELVLFTS